MDSEQQLCDIGFIGLGVMGKNLTLNLADNGYRVAAFDLDHSKVKTLLSQDDEERGDIAPRIEGCSSFTELLSKLKAPHLIVLSVPAGVTVDDVCDKLVDAGIRADDIVVDTGNSLWTDTIRREKHYQGKLIFFSTAVSGGEVGARFGPSLMPSGDRYAWTRIEPIWHAIAAKVDPKTGKALERTSINQPLPKGEACADFIGPAGAGHYVKMVHNGIEYADMQLICEAYQIMRETLSMTPVDIARVFRKWNEGVLNSYLIGISIEVLEQDDPESGLPLVDVIMDKAGQKGTGLWTAVSCLEVGSPATTIAHSVFARSLSAMKDERVQAAKMLKGPTVANPLGDDAKVVIQQLHDALYCSKICAYAQGFQLMKMNSKEQGWSLDFASIAKVWRAGCIIRAAFLQSITQAYQRDEDLQNLLLDSYFSDQIDLHQNNWRRAIAHATLAGIPCGAFSSALAYYDSYRSENLPANLLQGQRDYFGAHTFERVDKTPGKKFHVRWNEPGRPIVGV
ncbi:MAG: 6-phosphogluconate dehydrogenase [Alteromonadaceae bacterium]|jgi:6-phosphogluconate dehydrogenase